MASARLTVAVLQSQLRFQDATQRASISNLDRSGQRLLCTPFQSGISAPLTSPGTFSHQCSVRNLDSRNSFGNNLSLSSSFSSFTLCLKDRRASRSFNPQRRVTSASIAAVENAPSTFKFEGKRPGEITVAVVGATGYIGKFVTKEFIARGYRVIAVARERSGIGGKADTEATRALFPDAEVLFGDVTDIDSLKALWAGRNVDVVVSCLASRTGGKKDSWLIDYQATKNSLEAGKAAGASHFVLLSAICVQKPLLEFQHAKLKFERELQAETGITHSIVRPTAFFKSLGGQVEGVKAGGPYVMFGDGQLSACKPISEADLARFIADCVTDTSKINKVLPIGGPTSALTPLQQGELLFQVVGKDPKFIKVPLGIMDGVIGFLDFLAKFFPSLEDGVEFGKIGRYYAAESMLVYDPETGKYDEDATPSYGEETLEDFFRRVVRDGMAGQDLGDQAVFK
eukprot:TRINITY_DN12531_c0_g1_i1.p1 TRINITY_DN12531_c0_g1~~TRINITY_DN12531_c0_g1_i1.p1  ORF type:complete len:456 (-),score=64.17 TRINITY_DN12531_c0_g1_i1:546-1913(-)